MRPESASGALRDVAGELRLSLGLAEGRIGRVELASTRPDVAQALLQGRTPAEAQAAVPLLFSICAESQATACRLACAAAEGVPPNEADLSAARAGIAAETVRELSRQALLSWPHSLGETASEAAVQAARLSRAWRCGASAPHLEVALFGMSAGDWLALPSWPALRDWSMQTQTGPARFIANALHQDSLSTPQRGPAFLPPPDRAWLGELARLAQADAAVCRWPLWQGEPAETGALARLHTDPLLASPSGRPGSRTPMRFVARLRELAWLLFGHRQPALGALSLGPGLGLGWVENARGLLVHAVHIAHDRLANYRIVAPTEWNFHPRGALASALLGATVGSAGQAVALAEQVVGSLDPCVACQVEVSHA
jgi:hypothetical protein